MILPGVGIGVGASLESVTGAGVTGLGVAAVGAFTGDGVLSGAMGGRVGVEVSLGVLAVDGTGVSARGDGVGPPSKGEESGTYT